MWIILHSGNKCEGTNKDLHYQPKKYIVNETLIKQLISGKQNKHNSTSRLQNLVTGTSARFKMIARISFKSKSMWKK